MKLEYEDLDGIAVAVYLEVPGSKVVLFQAFFDIYEDVGFVRTIDIKRSRVCVVTTKDLFPKCKEILESIKSNVPWRLVEKPEDHEKIFGYSRKGEK